MISIEGAGQAGKATRARMLDAAPYVRRSRGVQIVSPQLQSRPPAPAKLEIRPCDGRARMASAYKRIVVKPSGMVHRMNGGVLRNHISFLARMSLVPRVHAHHCGRRRQDGHHYICQAHSSGACKSTLDEPGIDMSKLNANLPIPALGARSCTRPATTLQEACLAAYRGLVASGQTPGQSANGTAALMARKLHVVIVLSATDVEGVYDKDLNAHEIILVM